MLFACWAALMMGNNGAEAEEVAGVAVTAAAAEAAATTQQAPSRPPPEALALLHRQSGLPQEVLTITNPQMSRRRQLSTVAGAPTIQLPVHQR